MSENFFDITKTAKEMVLSLHVLTLKNNGEQKLREMVYEFGFTDEKLIEIDDFIRENIDKEEFENYVEREAYHSYIQGLKEIEKIMNMAKGYQEMANMNTGIAEEFAHLEQEGDKYDEMDSQKGRAQNQ